MSNELAMLKTLREIQAPKWIIKWTQIDAAMKRLRFDWAMYEKLMAQYVHTSEAL